MGQTISCCLGAPVEEEYLKGNVLHAKINDDAMYTMGHFLETVASASIEPLQDASSTSNTSHEESTTWAKIPSFDEIDLYQQEPSIEPSPEQVTHDLQSAEIIESNLDIFNERSRSESDIDTLLENTMDSIPLVRSSSVQFTNEVAGAPPPPLARLSAFRGLHYNVRVLHFTPHLTGSIYDFLVEIIGAKPLHISHSRYACKKYYAILKHVVHKDMPPFPPKAGLGILSSKGLCDTNSCSFMQDFIDRLLAIDSIRYSPVSFEFFGMLRVSQHLAPSLHDIRL